VTEREGDRIKEREEEKSETHTINSETERKRERENLKEKEISLCIHSLYTSMTNKIRRQTKSVLPHGRCCAPILSFVAAL